MLHCNVEIEKEKRVRVRERKKDYTEKPKSFKQQKIYYFQNGLLGRAIALPDGVISISPYCPKNYIFLIFYHSWGIKNI